MTEVSPAMRVSILFITALLFYAIAASSGANTKPNDVYGWENLKWGMPASEVESVLGKGVEKRQPSTIVRTVCIPILRCWI